ncbi:MAG: Cytochrome bd-I ubiquinol oxidase subunit 2 [Chlamydiae bacterium]|nr:Cytochrome bd-I ubiquinol oxidase subunit 2 [Chlamydiota bacterium]
MSVEFLEIFWYCIIFIALFAFAALDGFDLGVGILHPLARKDEERRVFLNAIGPVWDGNAVWLVIVAGGLFAGFPHVFATLFSSLYDLMMILLAGIIFRAVAIEFRSKSESKAWRAIWDYAFFFASLVMSLAVGFVLANIIKGLPIDSNGIFQGSFGTFFDFYTIVFAISVVSLFMMHGLIFLLMKTEPPLRQHLRRWALPVVFFFVLCTAILTLSTWFLNPHMTYIFRQKSWMLSFAGVGILLTLFIIRDVFIGHMGRAFIWSSGVVLVLFSLCALGKFPTLIHSSINSCNDLTIYNARSSQKTLTVLFYIVVIGVPFVLAYSIWLYRSFRGKVVVDSHSY